MDVAKPAPSAYRGAADEGCPSRPGNPGRAHRLRGNDPGRSIVPLPGGSFMMGGNDPDGFPADGEGPVRQVTLSPFRIDPFATTNLQFAEFVGPGIAPTPKATAGPSSSLGSYPPATPYSRRRRGALVAAGVRGRSAAPGRPRLHRLRPGRPSRRPCVLARRDRLLSVGGSKAADRSRVGVRGTRRSAAGALRLGRRVDPNGQWMCNVWQGAFPTHNTLEDGVLTTAPVDEPNGFGLHKVAGNVWEWCADWFSPEHTHETRNPVGPSNGHARVIRGGSYLCHHSCCNRYRVAARAANTPDSSTGNMGFRCAAD